jgi:hypothetical protein
MTTHRAVIDLSEIDRINSCGVRDWVNWLGRINKSGTRDIILEQCSPSIVAQINLVSNFTGAGKVRSFFAPYFCPNCDKEKVLLVYTRDVGPQMPYKAPICRCDECDGVMDFDDMEDSFFAFLANLDKITIEPEVEAAINEFTPTTGEGKVRLRQSISNPGAGVPGVPNSPQAPVVSGTMPALSSGRTGVGMGMSGSSFSPVTKTGTGPGLTGSGQKWPSTNPGLGPEESRRFTLAPPEQKSAGAWILVGVLVVAAIALLAYVLFSNPAHPTHGAAAAPPAALHIT